MKTEVLQDSILHCRTNQGELAKYSIKVVKPIDNPEMDVTVIINKKVLTQQYEIAKRNDWKIVKTFKEYLLISQTMSMKLETFGIITEIIDGTIGNKLI